MIPRGDQWGPWNPTLDEAERRACLRSLRQTARLLTGPRGTDLCRYLARAERDPAALEPAHRALHALTGHDQRSIWAAYLGLIKSAA